MSAKGRVPLRAPISSASVMAPMGALRTSAFAPTSFRVKSETEMAAAAKTIMMALKDGQMPIVIGASCVYSLCGVAFTVEIIQDFFSFNTTTHNHASVYPEMLAHRTRFLI